MNSAPSFSTMALAISSYSYAAWLHIYRAGRGGANNSRAYEIALGDASGSLSGIFGMCDMLSNTAWEEVPIIRKLIKAEYQKLLAGAGGTLSTSYGIFSSEGTQSL